jgi:polysaccharide export outer membrane protein
VLRASDLRGTATVAFEESRAGGRSNPLHSVAQVDAGRGRSGLAPALRYRSGMKTTTALAFAIVIALAPAAESQTPSSPAASPGTTSAAVRPEPAPNTVPAPPPPVPVPVDYVIGPGDVLSISVWKNEALSRVVPVRPDGKMSMPLLQDIHAAGLTAMQLRDKIANALVEFLPNPEVAVTVTEVNSFRVSILGEVAKPGVYQFRSAATVLEAIALAGGLGRYAAANKITIIRRDANGDTKKIGFNYNRAVTTTADEQNILLQPGDVIFVP